MNSLFVVVIRLLRMRLRSSLLFKLGMEKDEILELNHVYCDSIHTLSTIEECTVYFSKASVTKMDSSVVRMIHFLAISCLNHSISSRT